MSIWLTAKECVSLPGLPRMEHNIRGRLDKAAGSNIELRRRREGTKAFEYHIDCLPIEAREIVRQRHFNSVLEQPGCRSLNVPVANKKASAKPAQELEILRQCPALLEREVGSLTEQQKQVADARALLVQEIEKLRTAGMSRVGAVRFISEGSRNGSLPERLQPVAVIANARKGGRSGISVRSLQTWITVFEATKPGLERLALLAPGYKKETAPENVGWFYTLFAPHYHNQQGPTMKKAYRDFKAEWQALYAGQAAMLAALPSYDAVRRLVKKLPRREQMRGRVSGSAAKAFEIYSKRDWSQLPVNGCWIADGKSLELKVAHPITSRPFTPELTLVIDGRTRFVVGWSLSLAESCLGVADAYRYAMQRYGKPLFVYTDNGSGQTNKTLDADTTGIFPRMGIEHMLSRPGNPQARGIIERLNAVIPLHLAQRFSTYYGSSADPEKVRKMSQRLISLANAQRGNKELTEAQQKTLSQLPTWWQLHDAIEEEVQKYNNSHEHSELPKVNGVYMTPAAYRKMILEQEGDDIEYMTKGELREMFMPEVAEGRVAQRGWLQVGNNFYFSKELINVDGERVRVAFDTHDANEVIVRKMDGTYVCTAIWNGNTNAAIPVTDVERQLRKRAERQVKRGERIIQDATDSMRPVIEYQEETDFSRFLAPEPEVKQKVYLHEDDYEHDLKYGNHG